MATQQIKIPKEFITAANKFTRSMSGYLTATRQLQAQMRRQQQAVRRRPHYHDPYQVASYFRNLFQVIQRLELGLSRTVDRLSRETGFTRFLTSSQVEGLISRIPTSMIEAIPWSAGAARFAGVFLGPVGAVAGVALSLVIKAFLKTAEFSRQLTPEYYKTLGLGTDIGGLRSFGLTFGPYGFSLSPMTRALFDVSSPEAVAFRVFRITPTDSADALTSQLIVASDYLKSLPQGIVLQMAEGMGLSGMFSQEQILGLRSMTSSEIRRLAELYLARRRWLKIDPETIRKYFEFNRTLENAGVKVGNAVIKALIEGHPSIVEAMTRLSESFTKVAVKLANIVRILTPKIVNTLMEAFRFIKRIIDSFIGASHQQEKLLFRPGVGPRVAGRAPGPMFRPGVGPRARAKGAADSIQLPSGKREDPRALEQYIRETAVKYGIDPEIAIRVARSEGLTSFYGDNRTSFGAFQLHVTRGGGAVGDNFKRDTGLDPSDPKNERATIDYALRHARTHGWGAWSGARNQGIYGYRGVNKDAPIPPVTKYTPPTQTAPSTAPSAAPSATAGGIPRAYETRRGESGEFNYAATGALGPPGQNQTQIQLKNGKTVTVNKAVADRYEGFLNELIDRGYPIDSVGGYNYRGKAGGGGLSMHSYGAAVDINPDRNAFRGRTTDMPTDIEQMAWRHGLSWGGRFGDPMHFEPMSDAAWENKKRIMGGGGVAKADPSSMGPADNSLGAQRTARFSNELKDPETRRLLAASTEAEVGGQGPEAEHAYIESVFNRASARNKTLRDTLIDRAYYPSTTTNKLNRPVDPNRQSRIDNITGRVMQGSNVSNYATGNESGSVRSGGAPITRDFGRGKERFVRELPDKAWVNQQIGRAADKPTAITTKNDHPFLWPESAANKKSILYTGKDDDPRNKIKVENNDSETTVHVQESATADLSTAPL